MPANSVIITLTTAGLDTGPFNLYSNVTSYSIPFATNIQRNDLLTGITITVPTNTSTIKLESSNSTCSVYINLNVQNLPQCFCPKGYTVSNDNFNCYEELNNLPSSQLGPYYTATGLTNATYGSGGYKIYNIDDYNITGGSISGTYAINGTNYGPKVTPEEIFWSNRMNQTLVWVSGNTSWPNGDTGYPDFVGLCYYINVPLTQIYYIGIGADDDATILINGTEIINQNNTSVINHEIWNIYPFLLYGGPNYIEIECYNRSFTGGFGAEIYNNTLTELSVATGTSMLNIIFTTEDYKTGNVLEGSEFCSDYQCPVGYTFDFVSGYCKKIDYINCSTNSECVCVTVTIDERDIIAATGNTDPTVNNKLFLNTINKGGLCDGSTLDLDYFSPSVDYLCMNRSNVPDMLLRYYQNDIMFTGSSLFSTMVTGDPCTTNEDCKSNFYVHILNQQHLNGTSEIVNVTFDGNNLSLVTGAYPISYNQDGYASYGGGIYNVNVELSDPSGTIKPGTIVVITDSEGNVQCATTTGTTGNEILSFTSLVLDGAGLFTILCNDGPCAPPTPTPTPTSTPTPTPTSTPTPTPTSTPTPTPTSTPTPTPTPVPIYSYFAEIRPCPGCGASTGNVIVGSTSTLSAGDYTILLGSSAPHTQVYKIISGSISPSAFLVEYASTSCVTACNYTPLP